MEWILGVLGAALFGVLTNAFYDLLKYGTVRVPAVFRRTGLPPDARRHDPADDGLYAMVTWSRARHLKPSMVDVTYQGRIVRSHLYDVPAWHEQVAANRERGDAGRTAYLTAVSVDHGEHDAAHRFAVSVAESDYAEYLATAQVRATHPELAQAMDALMVGPTDEFLALVPPTSLTASVAVVSRNNTILLLRRSRSVRQFPQQWTVGINETMKYNAEPGAEEAFHSLALRGLKEETGLEPEDISSHVISWLGWSRQSSSFVTVNLVRSRLTETEIEERIGRCHSVYEHDRIAWWPLNRSSVAAIVTGGRSPDGRNTWIYLAALLARELWRCRNEL